MKSSRYGILLGILFAGLGVTFAVLGALFGLQVIPFPSLSGLGAGVLFGALGLLVGMASLLLFSLHDRIRHLEPFDLGSDATKE